MELRPRKLIQEERRCEHSSEQYFPERDGLPSKTNSLPQQAVVFALRYRLSCQLLFTRASERLSQRICVQWLRALAAEVERADLVAVGQLLSCSQGAVGVLSRVVGAGDALRDGLTRTAPAFFV